VPAAPAQRPPLAFYGFRAGAPLAEADAQVRLLLGPGLACRRSAADRRLQDCRAAVPDPHSGARLTVWLAAIDSVVGIVTVSATLPTDAFAGWREQLEATFGPRPATVEGSQRMVQWLRPTQMLRLTWRIGTTRTEASVSLVDGPVLESWEFAGAPQRIAKPPPPD